MAAMFRADIPLLWRHSVRDEGMIRNCFGSNPVSWYNALDAAELCVVALLHPARFADRVAHYLPGPEVLDFHQVAKTLSQVLDRPVGFEPISREARTEQLLELASSPRAGLLKPDIAWHISVCGYAVANGLERGNADFSDTGLFERLAGRAPGLLHHFLTEQTDLFRAR